MFGLYLSAQSSFTFVHSLRRTDDGLVQGIYSNVIEKDEDYLVDVGIICDSEAPGSKPNALVPEFSTLKNYPRRGSSNYDWYMSQVPVKNLTGSETLHQSIAP